MNNLIRFRQALGKTQGEIAADIGVAQSSINRYETGAMQPSKAVLARIADYAMAMAIIHINNGLNGAHKTNK